MISYNVKMILISLQKCSLRNTNVQVIFTLCSVVQLTGSLSLVSSFSWDVNIFIYIYSCMYSTSLSFVVCRVFARFVWYKCNHLLKGALPLFKWSCCTLTALHMIYFVQKIQSIRLNNFIYWKRASFYISIYLPMDYVRLQIE